jgi:hypothetical protein
MHLSLVSNKETKLKLTALTFEPGILFNRCSQLIGFFHFRDMQLRKQKCLISSTSTIIEPGFGCSRLDLNYFKWQTLSKHYNLPVYTSHAILQRLHFTSKHLHIIPKYEMKHAHQVLKKAHNKINRFFCSHIWF